MLPLKEIITFLLNLILALHHLSNLSNFALQSYNSGIWQLIVY